MTSWIVIGLLAIIAVLLGLMVSLLRDLINLTAAHDQSQVANLGLFLSRNRASPDDLLAKLSMIEMHARAAAQPEYERQRIEAKYADER